MTYFAAFKHPPSHLARIRVSYSGPSTPPPSSSKSPLPSPRCHAAPSATKLDTASYVTPSDSTSSVARTGPAHSNISRAHTGSKGTLRLATYDDSYDSAVPMSGAPCWDRVEDDWGLDAALLDADPQEWEEMVSLLSFDGEEHKRVMRQTHGANTRVEDMFASFDGDDFEAVLRAARGELPSERQADTEPSQPAARVDIPGDNSDSQGAEIGLTATTELQTACSAADSQAPTPAALLQSLPAHVGLSCDSSSDGGCHPESGGSAAHHAELLPSTPAAAGFAGADSAAEASRHQAKAQQQLAAAAASVSNNIVSSRALATRLSAPAMAMAVAGGREVARDELLEAAAAAPERLPARAALLQQGRGCLAAQPFSGSIKQSAAEVAAKAADSARAAAASSAAPPATEVQSDTAARWSSRGTGALRRALARLHVHLPAQ